MELALIIFGEPQLHGNHFYKDQQLYPHWQFQWPMFCPHCVRALSSLWYVWPLPPSQNTFITLTSDLPHISYTSPEALSVCLYNWILLFEWWPRTTYISWQEMIAKFSWILQAGGWMSHWNWEAVIVRASTPENKTIELNLYPAPENW